MEDCQAKTLNIPSPIGDLWVTLQGNSIVELAFPTETQDAAFTGADGNGIQETLSAYFAGKLKQFKLDLSPSGTPFQRRVWQRLEKIPYGQTVTYGELAKELGSHARAVGQACRRNPIVILIPCHRVVGANGLCGYGGARVGDRMTTKQWLLDHESGCLVS